MRPPPRSSAPILLLDAAGPEAHRLLVAAAARRIPVHAVAQPTDVAYYTPERRRLLAGLLLTDLHRSTRALDDITRYARQIGAAGALTTNEYLTVLLARVCAALGLPGNDPDRALAARDKAVMHAAFTHHGVAAPCTHVVDDEDDLQWLSTTGALSWPCVVKPADGAGSAGVTVVTDPARLAAAWRTARDNPGRYGVPAYPRILLQEHIAGTEYSVESITHNGVTTHVCSTAKTVTGGAHRVELGHSLPAVLPHHVQQDVDEQVVRAIHAVGIHHGASHTEVVIDDAGRCTVLEIGARLGAGHIGVLIEHALGVDVWTGLLDTALGRAADLTATRHGFATVRFVTSPRSGRLRAINGLPTRGPGIPDVRMRAAAGDTVHTARANSGRLGHVIVTGDSRAAVDKRAQQLLDRVDVDVEPLTVARRGS